MTTKDKDRKRRDRRYPRPQKTKSPVAKVERTLWSGRLLFMACLVSTAIVLGWVSHHFLTESEEDLARAHWDGIADRALSEAVGSLAKKRFDLLALASVIAETRPNATEWPYVYVPGYERIAHDLTRGTSTVIHFAPLVKPEELDSWVDFAYQYLHVDRKPVPFESDAGVSTAGRGVWAYNRTNGELVPHLEQSFRGNMVWNSTYNVLWPIFASAGRGVSASLIF